MIEIELDGVRHQVTVQRDGDRWIAGIGGREVAVSLVEAGGRWSLLVAQDDVASGFSRKSYSVSIEPGSNGELIVHVNGVAVPLTVVSGRRRGSRAGTADQGPRAILAPMPGRIVKVLVTANEAVAARQPLVVVEAMKMENELRAPRGGRVAEVRVSEGSSVEANAVLVVLE